MTYLWKKEEIFLSGEKYFERIISDIGSARSWVTVEMYIFNDDVLGKRVAQALIEASRRNVTVQLLVDGVGSHRFFQTLYPLFAQEKIGVKVYNPLPFLHPYYGKLNIYGKLHALGVRLLRLNKRDHRKIITIDEYVLYAGSFNITSEHTKIGTEQAWKDMGVRVQGEHVKFAVMNFLKSWRLRLYYQYKKKNRSLLSWKQSPIRLNSTIFMKRYFQKQFLNNMNIAQKRVWLMTPYFIPQRNFIKSLAKAAHRGVDVRLLLSQKSDVGIFRTLQTFYYPFLIKSGVKVYLYNESVLHAKTYLFDDWMTVGSSNLNHRSLMHDLEVDLIVQSEQNHKIIEDDFAQTVSTLRPLSLEDLKQTSIFDQFLTKVFFIFRYWL
jgi:cardiolipin synthase A/B